MLPKINAAKTHLKSDDDLVLSPNSSYNSLESDAPHLLGGKKDVKQNDSAVAKDLSDIASKGIS